jgi:choline dehydrogenase-like flavoprotein
VIRYTLDSEDARDMGAAIILLAEAFFAAGADRVLLPVSGMPAEVDSLSARRRLSPEDFTRDRLTLCGFHPQGTAGMGRAVDADLRLFGTTRISVCDASVLPDSPGVNPQITIMALSLRLADRLVAELQ